jgi:hypothetical protein
MGVFDRALVTVLRSDFATDKYPFISKKSPLAISGLYNRKAPAGRALWAI